ncbi:ABC transporter ATP-binding protein [soil metagenome]
MSRPAIIVDDIGKSYRIGLQEEKYPTFREAMVNAVKAPARRLRTLGERGTEADTFWALRHVDFEVQPGEVVGIIGRNGAGKSTLLKILSRITEPTEGLVRLRGRVASLLEVGTGFHPELTGRENIYLNGSILGMKRAEIDRKFDEIVAFAGVEQFLDTPVKRYSSGMYVRLAFAVAAHLEPEILVVDEVLAVGDANFQRRCIDRMSELSDSGRTILFVSHNMDLIPRLCDRAILLKEGCVQTTGPAGVVTQKYLEESLAFGAGDDLRQRTRSGNGKARFIRIQFVDPLGRLALAHPSGEDLTIRFEIESTCDMDDIAIAVNLHTIQGLKVVTSWTKELGFPVQLAKGRQVYECKFFKIRLRPGHKVIVSLWMADDEVIDYLDNARIVDVVDGADSERVSNRHDQGVIVYDYQYSRHNSWPA